jgi:hypothetical protein
MGLPLNERPELSSKQAMIMTVFVHVFTNNLRESSPEECVQLCTKFSVELSQQCEFAKIFISLPFPTVNDISGDD